MKIQKLKLGLVALLVGFGLVITQSAFTPKAETLYVRIDGLYVDETTVSGFCVNDENETCKYLLDPNSDPENPSYIESPEHVGQRWSQ